MLFSFGLRVGVCFLNGLLPLVGGEVTMVVGVPLQCPDSVWGQLACVRVCVGVQRM